MSEIIAKPQYDEGILILGETGCGKTLLTRRFIDTMERYIVIDTKRDFPLHRDDTLIKSLRDSRMWRHSPDRIVFRPNPAEGSGTALNWLLGKLYERALREGKRKPFEVVVDEGLAFARARSIVNLIAMCVSGRSIGIGWIVESQRPVGIPVEARDQAKRMYLFHIAKRKDRKEVLEYLPDTYTLADLEQQVQMHSFIEVRQDPLIQGGRTVRLLPPIRL